MAEQWIELAKSLSWCEEDSQTVRRRNALRSRHNSYFLTARALQALASHADNAKIRQKATNDAKHFWHRYRMAKGTPD